VIKEFLKPASVSEAIELKKSANSIWFGGGTWINHPKRSSVDVTAVGFENLGINGIYKTGNHIQIGSATTIQEIIDSDLVPSVLKEASRFIYSRNIRNIATIGGNIGAGETDSALIPCLIALSASVETQEEGILSVEKYIAESNNSLILSISITESGADYAVKKISRTASSSAIVTVAVGIYRKGSVIKEAVVVVGGVDSKVLRLGKVENELKNNNLQTDENIEKSVYETISPETNILGSAEYKKYITGVMVAACISECLGGDK
jgi:putative selenate reductase FAD-binding subunit